MSRDDLDLKLASLAAALGVVAALAIHAPALRAVPATLLVLGVPGYALSVALFPDPRDMAERALLAVGLSFCIDILTGLVLDRTGWGLTARSWSVTLAALTAVFVVLGVDRRRAGTTRRGRRTRPRAGWPRQRTVSFLAAAAVLGLAVGALLIARLPASGAHVGGFTELWALPLEHGTGRIQIGIRSDELRATTYRLVARADSQVLVSRTMTLRPGQARTIKERLPTSVTASGTLRVALYRSSKPTSVYRRVFLSFPEGT